MIQHIFKQLSKKREKRKENGGQYPTGHNESVEAVQEPPSSFTVGTMLLQVLRGEQLKSLWGSVLSIYLFFTH